MRDNIFVGTDITTHLTLTDGPDITVRVSNSARGRVFEPGETAFVTVEAGAARLLAD